jgi:tetratricopeptide (TPR) repeat protein
MEKQQPSDAPPIECGYCGFYSTLTELLQPRSISSNKPNAKVCPGCIDKLDAKSHQNIRFVLLLSGGLFLTLSILDNDDTFSTSAFIWLFAFYAVSGISLVLHELGHLIATKLLGGIVPKVVIGTGKTLFKFKFFSTTWEFNSIWTIGLTFLGFPSEINSINSKLPKSKYMWAIAAGPLVNLGLGTAAAILAFSTYSSPILAVVFDVSLVFLVVNIIFFFGSLYPSQAKGAIKYDSDGKLLIKFYKNRKSTIKRFKAQFHLVYLLSLHERGEDKAALDISRVAIAKFTNDENLTNLYGVLLIADHCYDEAIALYEKILSKQTQLPLNTERKQQIAMMRNNLSYALYEKGDTDVARILQEAKIAFDAIPWNPAVLQTYGCALTLNGEVEKGIEILERAFSFKQSSTSMCQGYASLGIAHLKMKEITKATAYYERAKKMGKSSTELKRLEDALHLED